MEEEVKNEIEEETRQTKVNRWMQDNMRVIISVLIVVAIAGGIYSYSKRGEVPTVGDQVAQEETVTTESTTTPISEDNTEKIAEEKTETETKAEVEKPAAPVASSQETDGTFIETAGPGDGSTVLARRALANYLEKNEDSALTPAHKIYIEDYLRKNVSHKGGVKIGTSIEFSKSMIQDAIAKSKNLNEGQVKNLQKYAVRVPSLA